MTRYDEGLARMVWSCGDLTPAEVARVTARYDETLEAAVLKWLDAWDVLGEEILAALPGPLRRLFEREPVLPALLYGSVEGRGLAVAAPLRDALEGDEQNGGGDGKSADGQDALNDRVHGGASQLGFPTDVALELGKCMEEDA